MILIDKQHNRYKLDHRLTSKYKRKKTGEAWIPHTLDPISWI